MNGYQIPILGNYGMEESEIVNGEFRIIKEERARINKRAFTRKCMKLRKKYGYMNWKGDPLEFHESGMVTFGLLGTKADKTDKLAFDPDKMKRRAMLPEMSYFSSFMGPPVSWVIYPRGVYLLASIYTLRGYLSRTVFLSFPREIKNLRKALTS